MRGKKRFRFNFFAGVFHHRPCDAQSVVSAGSPAYFVKYEQAVFGCEAQNHSDLAHFHHKRALIENQVVACAHAGKHSVDNGNARVFCRHERAYVRHNRNQSDLPHICAFARHVRSGYYHHRIVAA